MSKKMILISVAILAVVGGGIAWFLGVGIGEGRGIGPFRPLDQEIAFGVVKRHVELGRLTAPEVIDPDADHVAGTVAKREGGAPRSIGLLD